VSDDDDYYNWILSPMRRVGPYCAWVLRLTFGRGRIVIANADEVEKYGERVAGYLDGW